MMSRNDNLPDGCTTADIDRAFGDSLDNDGYSDYVRECEADCTVPMLYDDWIDEQVAESEREEGRRDAEADREHDRKREAKG